MNGIQFGDKHTYDDWGLILVYKNIGFPEPKTSSVNIEGSNGVLDTSEVLSGEIKFGNRALSYEFVLQDKYEDFDDKVQEMANYLHGKKLKIIQDSDPLCYFYGRCTINQWTTDKRVGRIVIYCDCDPYKYDTNDSVVIKPVNGVTNVEILGKRMTVCPIINCSNAMTMTANNTTYELIQGDNEILDVFIKEGYNYLKFDGNGVVKITFKGGVL